MDLRFVAVHAARARGAPARAARSAARRRDRFPEHRILEELAGLDRVLDLRVVLKDDAPGADIHVADFGIAHLIRGSPTHFSDASIVVCGYFCQSDVPMRLACLADGVVLALFAVSEAVENNQKDGRYAHDEPGGDALEAGCAHCINWSAGILARRRCLLEWRPPKRPPSPNGLLLPMEQFLLFLQKSPMNLVLLGTVLVSGGMIVWPLIARVLRPGQEVETSQAVQLINRRDAVVIDVRDAEEYKAGHITNARHIPAGELGDAREGTRKGQNEADHRGLCAR